MGAPPAPSIAKSVFTSANETSTIITGKYSRNGRSISMLGTKTQRARKARRARPKAVTKSTPTPGDTYHVTTL